MKLRARRGGEGEAFDKVKDIHLGAAENVGVARPLEWLEHDVVAAGRGERRGEPLPVLVRYDLVLGALIET